MGRDYRAGQQFRPPPDWAQRFGQGGGQRCRPQWVQRLFLEPVRRRRGGRLRRCRQYTAETRAGTLDITLEEAFAGTKRRVALNEAGRSRTVDVQIPAGVTEGQSLRIPGSGGRSLVFRIKLLAHPLYSVQGRDVLIDLPLAPWEAALGAKVPVPTLGGRVELTVPAGAQSGQKLRLRGRGFPGAPAGDQFVVVKLVIPAAHSARAEAYERMRRELSFDPRAGWPD